MQHSGDFTKGPILSKLLRFAVPILGAMILQAMYGAVDLLVVGQFASAADVSAVSTGTQIMHTITCVITGLSMGTTILMGQSIGAGQKEKAGDVIGNAILLFGALALLITALVPLFASPLCRLMQAPAEAFSQTVAYLTICALGTLFIVAYNLLGSLFRGMGDSKTPLLAVTIACVVNIMGDLLFVAVLHMGAAGAALATVLAQGVSVVLCLMLVKKHGLPFAFGRRNLRVNRPVMLHMVRLGTPIALQDLLVSISFLVILAIVNSLGVIVSAGVGVAEKLCAFIMLVPSAFSQSLSAFVTQNIGAGEEGRARRALVCGISASVLLGAVMAYAAFFHGDALAAIFTPDPQVIAAGWDYLKAYAIDTLLVSFMFCFTGYFSGCGDTTFVMIQGIVGAFGVRIPVSFLMSRITPVSVFYVGLATPSSTLVQIVLCVMWFMHRQKKLARRLSA